MCAATLEAKVQPFSQEETGQRLGSHPPERVCQARLDLLGGLEGLLLPHLEGMNLDLPGNDRLHYFLHCIWSFVNVLKPSVHQKIIKSILNFHFYLCLIISQ